MLGLVYLIENAKSKILELSFEYLAMIIKIVMMIVPVIAGSFLEFLRFPSCRIFYFLHFKSCIRFCIFVLAFSFLYSRFSFFSAR